jgi:ubiquinone/menaquinone biosynthesis C-methylase UbiE
MKKKITKNQVRFFIDTSVMEYNRILTILEDYFYWFKPEDETLLVLFASSQHPKNLQKLLRNKKKDKSPNYSFIEGKISPEELHKYYTKRFLLNEWGNYQKHDIFRLYKFFYPLKSDINFDNQAISIQYDVRYHNNRNDEYASYKKEQLSALENALHYYKPKNILDMGCGTGAQYFFLKDTLDKYKIKYHGVDISRFQTIKAIDLYENNNTHFELGNAMNLPMKDSSFDISFSESTLPFLPNPVKGVTELNRVSKRGFFASLYTIKKEHAFLNPFKKNNIYALDTGATWKYLNKITPNIYYLPEYKFVMDIAKNFENVIVVEENSDQFFEPLDVSTSNLFFFPKDWFNNTQKIDFNFRPLM